VALGLHNELKDEIPPNEFFEHFGPNPRLHIDTDVNMENKNSRQYLEQTLNTVLENLNRLKGPPSVQFQDVPADFVDRDNRNIEDEENEDQAATETNSKKLRAAAAAEFLRPSEGALAEENEV
jgi:histone deacetylase 1/2